MGKIVFVLLVGLVASALALPDHHNLAAQPVPALVQRVGVDIEDILEDALERSMYPLGIRDVDVDDLYSPEGTYRVGLTASKSLRTLEQDTKADLDKALKDLGFADANIKDGLIGRSVGLFDDFKDEYIISLNPSTLRDTLGSLARPLVRVGGDESPEDWWD